MAFVAIANIAPQYENYPNYWLKAYEQGGTTPLVMSLFVAGTPTVAKLELDAQGFLKSAGNARVIPYIDGAYDAWLIPTEAEADANDLTNAIQVADNIDPTAVFLATQDVATYAEMDALPALATGTTVTLTGAGIAGPWVVDDAAYTADVGTIRAWTLATGNQHLRRLYQGGVQAEWFEITRNVSGDRVANSAALVAAHGFHTDIHFSPDTTYYFDDWQPANKSFNLIGGGLGNRDEETNNTVLDFSVTTAAYALNLDSTLPLTVESSFRGMLIKCPTDKDCLFIDQVGISLYEVMIKANIPVTVSGMASMGWRDVILMGATKALHQVGGFMTNNVFDKVKMFTNYTAVTGTDINLHIEPGAAGLCHGNVWNGLNLETGATAYKTDAYFVADVFIGLWVEGMSTKWEDEGALTENIYINPVHRSPSSTSTYSTKTSVYNRNIITARQEFREISTGTTTMVVDTAGNWTKPTQSRFRAYLSTAQLNLATTGSATILFDTEDYDKGADFNVANYTFTAPVAGTYYFDVKIRIDNADTAASAYTLALKVGGVTTLANVENPGVLPSDGFFNMRLSGDIDLAAAALVLVTIAQSGGSAQADINATASESWFSGRLVC